MECAETMDTLMPPFTYEEFTTRNIGFVTQAQQASFMLKLMAAEP